MRHGDARGPTKSGAPALLDVHERVVAAEAETAGHLALLLSRTGGPALHETDEEWAEAPELELDGRTDGSWGLHVAAADAMTPVGEPSDGGSGVPASAASCRLPLPSTARMTIILVMSTQSLAAVKAHFSQVIDEVTGTHERVVVTRNGSPVAVIMAVDDYESLMETLEVLSDRSAVAEIREAERQMVEGEAFSEEQVRAALAKRRT